MQKYLLALAPLLLGAGFYHPADVAPRSEAYARASNSAGTAFEEKQNQAQSLAAALQAYEEALDLAGSRAPAAERQRLETVRTAFNRSFAVFEAFAVTMMEDFDAEFIGAMERAAAAVGGDQICEGQIPDGKPMPGIRPRMKSNPDCKGEDLNGAVAEAMDADAALASAIDEILALEWPAMGVAAEAQAPLGDGARYIHLDVFMRTGAARTLQRIDQADDEARLAFQADIESGASTEELEKHLDKAREITARTAQRRAMAAESAIVAADKILAKWTKKGEPATAWCLNPEALGGCSGTDATGELVSRLLDEKKIIKALP